MSEEVEQITKTPVTESVKKEKDPKKVAAGKKLAEYNRKAKEALKEKMNVRQRSLKRKRREKRVNLRQQGGGFLRSLSQPRSLLSESV